MGLSAGARAGPRGPLRRLAAGAPAPVFPAVGCGGREAAGAVALDPRVERVASPRHASLLLVVGELPSALVRPLLRVHDQVPAPRATARWRPVGGEDGGPCAVSRFLPEALLLPSHAEVDAAAGAIRRLHLALLRGERESEPIAGPDVPPAPWRGVGPHGQGGEGMMGGRPYGRPLPMRGPDRDGLELDRLPLRVGPFFPPLPPGLTLYPTLQGDVIQELAVAPNPFEGATATGTTAWFARALHEPVAVAALECARARSHLLWLAEALGHHGLAALAERALRLALRVRPEAPVVAVERLDEVRRLRRTLDRWRSVRPATRGVGTIGPETVEESWGPVARAAGVEADARVEDRAYADLGFRPVLGTRGDAEARLAQRLEEAIQALELAGRAADAGAIREPGRPLEAPAGRLGSGGPAGGVPLARLPDRLVGLEWGDALTTLVSLDLDLDARAGLRAAAGSGPEELGPARRDRGAHGLEGEAGRGDGHAHGDGHTHGGGHAHGGGHERDGGSGEGGRG